MDVNSALWILPGLLAALLHAGWNALVKSSGVAIDLIRKRMRHTYGDDIEKAYAVHSLGRRGTIGLCAIAWELEELHQV